MPGLCRACWKSVAPQALGVAFLLTHEGFQESLCSQVGVPSSSEGDEPLQQVGTKLAGNTIV